MILVDSVINSVKSFNALHGLFIILISEMGQILREREREASSRQINYHKKETIHQQAKGPQLDTIFWTYL